MYICHTNIPHAPRPISHIAFVRCQHCHKRTSHADRRLAAIMDAHLYRDATPRPTDEHAPPNRDTAHYPPNKHGQSKSRSCYPCRYHD